MFEFVVKNRILVRILLPLPLIILFMYTYISIHKPSSQISSELKHKNKYWISTSRCLIPEDSFDDEVKHLIWHENYVPCRNIDLLTYVQENGGLFTLHINESLLSSYSYFKLSCCYSIVTREYRKGKHEDQIRFSGCQNFEDGKVVADEVIKVKCSNFLRVVYENVHAVINPRKIPPRSVHDDNEENGTTFSVVFIGIDSVSKINFLRAMPKTNSFLNKNNFLTLRGYNKVGDNTFPNLVAILTGRNWTQVYDYCDPKVNPMNKCGLIWDEFKRLGYVTAYAEDSATLNTFNYGRLGFSVPPTDYYFRPYMLAAEFLRGGSRRQVPICTGPENTGQRILNVAKDFIVSFENRPKFGFFWMVSFSHEDLNLPSSMDEKMEEFFNSIFDKLGNTILVFLSDHGFRFGDIRYTHAGYVEERFPFIYIYIPDSFKEKYVKEYNTLLINAERLTSPFDIFMTLQSILSYANKSYTPRESIGCPKCHSLFTEIEEDRSCEDGGIDEEWCLCTKFSTINPDNEVALGVATFVVSKINEVIRNYEDGKKCALYRLKAVKSASVLENYLNLNNKTSNRMLLVVETNPYAAFEATVEYFESSNHETYRILGDFSRINRYSSYTECVRDVLLKKYCNCFMP